MSAKQSVFRVRRQYNQWVNNQTLEDFALRFTAKRARRFSFSQIVNTALGSISFLALEAIGAALTLNYGFVNAAWAIAVVSGLIFLLGIPICFHAAKSGLDIDLLTRGAGFGYIGSTVTSLIYASFTFIFFAIETAIMAIALEWVLGIPLFIGYIVCSLVVIPLVTHGITFISRFQRSTQVLWITLQVVPLVVIVFSSPHILDDWFGYKGTLESSAVPSLDVHLFGAACAVIFALVAQIGEQVDYIRFMPKQEPKNRAAWWWTLFSAGPGWVVIGAIKMLIGGLLATFAINQGLSPDDAADPTRMYANAFGQVIPIPELSLVVAVIFVIISQLKINVTNAYAGSIAWSNFFSRLTHNHPGRVVWLIFNVIIAIVLMELGIYQAFEHILSGYGLIAIAWLGAVVGDLAISKPLNLSPKRIEFIRAHSYAINPVGIGSMIIAVIGGLLCYSGMIGALAQSLAHFFTLILALLCSPFLAWFTGAKYFIARENHLIATTCKTTQDLECCICENNFEVEDMAYCPAYEGSICSLCCSLDARCDDVCKPKQRRFAQYIERLKALLPSVLHEFISERLINFLGLMIFSMLISGSLLAVIYINAAQQLPNASHIADIWKIIIQIFFVLQIALGVVAWLFVLANSSRRVAIEESQIQTQRLLSEIAAHDETDKKLQQAKDDAEAANNAKSRYLTGLSHELRTPLNSILGYAQLLEEDSAIPKDNQRQISVIKRSGEHLGDLIEGLLDISKIEAGRLDLHRNKVAIHALIEQLAYMFRPQADNKQLKLNIHYLSPLPDFVMTDEKRLRQILINLLSNAIKYTHEGEVDFAIRYRNQVAEFTISDTGIGIPVSERERIFKPFERLRTPGVPQVTGTGLGLTITRLLVDIMGGDLRLSNREDIDLPYLQNTALKNITSESTASESTASESTAPESTASENITLKNTGQSGSIFSVSLMMSSVHEPSIAIAPAKVITGYAGRRRSIVVLDDDPFHRGLIFEALNPLGFSIFEAPDIEFAKNHLLLASIDLFILDVNLPDGSGWDFAKNLRQSAITAPIIMVSADAEEGYGESSDTHDAYIIKPIKIKTLIHEIQSKLDLEWHYSEKRSPHEASPLSTKDIASNNPATCTSAKNIITTFSLEQKNELEDALIALEECVSMGHVAGIKDLLNSYTPGTATAYFLEHYHAPIQRYLDNFDFKNLGKDLRIFINECHT